MQRIMGYTLNTGLRYQLYVAAPQRPRRLLYKGAQCTDSASVILNQTTFYAALQLICRCTLTDGACATLQVGLILDQTSFYATSGGQVNDTGAVTATGGASLAVADCIVAANYVLHLGTVSGNISVGDAVECAVDFDRRRCVALWLTLLLTLW